MSDIIAYLNGEFLPLVDARISPLDRGFLFADSAYEVIPVYQGKIFHGIEHLQRLSRSLEALRLPNPLANLDEAMVWLTSLVERNGGGDLSLYLQITRGAQPVRDHKFPKNPTPTVFAYCAPLVPPTLEKACLGIRAITRPDPRWSLCHIKSTALIGNVLAYQEAIDLGCDETLLIRDGILLEGASSNLFVAHNGIVYTANTDHHILGGITRDIILQLLSENHVPVELGPVDSKILQSCDELWICSSTREIRPVIEVDGRPVGLGHIGPLCTQLLNAYHDYKEHFIHG